MNKIVSTAAALSAVALTAGLIAGTTGIAHAERYGIDDPDDSPHGSDLHAVDIRNGADDLVVVTTHDNLRRDPSTGSAGAIFISTDPEDLGPEYVFVGGFTDGTDYQLVHTEGFAVSQWGDPVEDGDYRMKVDYKADTVRFKISRAAIGDATDVRIAVRVGGSRTDGTTRGLTDWLGQPRAFTPWIAQG
ncbi:hypothetical protein [Nocardioides sp. MH1]|uniref:hypothetical protein n=1 Tax=Nocardioides sp. MH1 TaxID=3242490 RepID=UPI003521053C